MTKLLIISSKQEILRCAQNDNVYAQNDNVYAQNDNVYAQNDNVYAQNDNVYNVILNEVKDLKKEKLQ